MNSDTKRTLGWATLMILLGVVALFAGVRSLILLIPVAALVWHSAGPLPRRGRN